MKRLIQGMLLLLTVVTLGACGTQSADNENAKLTVVTSFYPMYDFTKKVVGDTGEVSLLVDGNVEPHDYEPSAKDIAKIQDADVFVYHSKDMETWVPAVLKLIDTERTKVIEANEGIAAIEETHESGDHQHASDPHTWLDPVLAQQQVKNIRDGITAAKPEFTKYLADNALRFNAELEKLNQDYLAAFKDADNRVFVTQHSAFSYLAKRYDLEQRAIAGISPEQEPTPAELGKVEDFVKEQQIKVIYTEGLSSSKIGETIAKATGAELVDLRTLESLSEKERTAGEDYLSVMTDNLSALKIAIN